MEYKKIANIPLRYQKDLSLKSVIFIMKYYEFLKRDNTISDNFYKQELPYFRWTKLEEDCYLAEYKKNKPFSYKKSATSLNVWRYMNPKKVKAHRLVFVAKRNGSLIAKDCEKCSNPKTQAHHEDYSKPLDVTWLCKECHVQRHKELGWGFGYKHPKIDNKTASK